MANWERKSRVDFEQVYVTLIPPLNAKKEDTPEAAGASCHWIHGACCVSSGVAMSFAFAIFVFWVKFVNVDN